MNTLPIEFGLIFAAATLCALVARLFKQPPIVGYILCGIGLGPLGAHFFETSPTLVDIRHLGLALLLFLIGMELDWRKARHQLHTAFFLGIIQVLGSFSVGLLFSTLLGLDTISGIYIGTAIAFSSAVVVVKLLSESGDINSLHGRLSIGLLILQDIIAAIMLVVLTGLTTQTNLSLENHIGLLVIKAISVLVILYGISRYVLPPLFDRIARSGELLFLSSISWCFVVAIGISLLGFPLEVGAFLAGISLASLSYSLDITNRLRSLRDFFVLLLFVGLGSDLSIPHSGFIFLTIGLTVITIVLKPFLTFIILHARGYKSRTAFFTALTQGQISEFSVVLIELGVLSHVISHDVASSVIFATVVSIFISSLLLGNRVKLYNLVRPALHGLKQVGRRSRTTLNERPFKDHIVIFGYHRMGYHILREIQKLDHKIIVVDFNPDIIASLKSQGIEAVYGDIQDEDILESVHASSASMIISTIPHREETEFLISRITGLNAHPLIIVTSHHIDHALAYYKLGASYVMLPHILGGEHVAELLRNYEGRTLDQFIHQHKNDVQKLLETKNHELYWD